MQQSGSVELLGESIHTKGAAERDRFRADHIGYIHQMFNLIPYLSVIENVTLPCRFSRRRQQRAKAQSPSSSAEARRLLAHIQRQLPDFSLTFVEEKLFYLKRPEQIDGYLQALRKAGLD